MTIGQDNAKLRRKIAKATYCLLSCEDVDVLRVCQSVMRDWQTRIARNRVSDYGTQRIVECTREPGVYFSEMVLLDGTTRRTPVANTYNQALTRVQRVCSRYGLVCTVIHESGMVTLDIKERVAREAMIA